MGGRRGGMKRVGEAPLAVLLLLFLETLVINVSHPELIRLINPLLELVCDDFDFNKGELIEWFHYRHLVSGRQHVRSS